MAHYQETSRTLYWDARAGTYVDPQAQGLYQGGLYQEAGLYPDAQGVTPGYQDPATTSGYRDPPSQYWYDPSQSSGRQDSSGRYEDFVGFYPLRTAPSVGDNNAFPPPWDVACALPPISPGHHGAAQKLVSSSSSSRKKKKSQNPPNPEPPPFPTNFCDVIRAAPPSAPPCLLRGGGRLQPSPGSGKVKVMLRVCPVDTNNTSSWLNVDARKKQVTVYDPSNYSGFTAPSRRTTGGNAPKMFAFDAIFPQDDSLAEICSTSLVEIIQAVVNGADGCLFCYGHARLGKTYTMLGVDDSPQNLGVIPSAIAWLFRLIEDQKESTGARFSVRVSAVEVTGKQEKLKDLLADVAGARTPEPSGTPGVCLREDPILGTQIENQSELRAPTAEQATYYLDAAIAARTVPEVEEDARNSHLLFTISVYQYKVEKSNKGQNGVAGGRSRLHLIDLGSCSKSRDANAGNALSLSALGNVILALLNGQRHVPHRESKLTQLVRESFGNWSCRTCMIAHVSPAVHAYNETLQVIQLASRIHRMKRRRSKFSGTSSDDSSCDGQSGRFRARMRPGVRMGTLREDGGLGFSQSDYSSSEMSCDTVIYVGANGRALSDRELTDNEGPPPIMPLLSRGDKSSGDDESRTDANKNSVIPSTFMAKPPKSPGSRVQTANVIQIPRRSRIKTTMHCKPIMEEEAQPSGSEHWVDGPAGCDKWKYGANNNPEDTPDKSEHWVDGPNKPATIKDSEQWVDGPSAFRVGQDPAPRAEPRADPSPRPSPAHKAHKKWLQMQKQQQESALIHQQSAGTQSASTQKEDSVRTPKTPRKEAVTHKKPRPVSDQLDKREPLVGAEEAPRAVDEVNADSSTSLSVNPDSRPVSCHGDEEAVAEDDDEEEEEEEDGDDVMYPVNSFVHDWVMKHSNPKESPPPEEPKKGIPRKSRKSHSAGKRPKPKPAPGSVDDQAVPAAHTQSPDRYVCSAQSSPRLRRLRKNGLPNQACPTDRTAAWVMSVQDVVTDNVVPMATTEVTTTTDLTANQTGTVTSSALAGGSESPECDRDLPTSPPPDYDSCVEEGLVVEPPQEEEESAEPPQASPQEAPKTDSVQDSEICDKILNITSSDNKTSSLDVTSMLMINRESIYELQMDEQLETGGDGTHKASFGSECSTESFQRPEDQSPEECPDEGILVVEVADCQLSPLTVQADNESGIASGGSGGHLSPPSSGGHLSSGGMSPPSSSDDSSPATPGKKLVRPSSLRRPDGASNPNLTEIMEGMEAIKEEASLSFELSSSSKVMLEGTVRNPAADGQSPESEEKPTVTSPVKTSKLPVKSSSIPSPSTQSVLPKPPKSSSKSSKSAEKPAVPPRGTKITSPTSTTSPSPSKSSLSSPIRNIFRSSSKDKTKLPKAGSTTISPVQEKTSIFSRSSSAKSSSKIPPASSTTSKTRSLSSPTSKTGIREPKTSSSRATSKSPSPTKRDKESRLPKFGKSSGRHTDSDSGNDSGIVKNDKKFLSPYSRQTRLRMSTHSASSGHGSDGSSSFTTATSPVTMATKTETSSGYESMIRDDSEASGESSNQDSESDGTRGGKGGKKDKGSRRSRSAPVARSSDSPVSVSRISSPGRPGGRNTSSPPAPRGKPSAPGTPTKEAPPPGAPTTGDTTPGDTQSVVWVDTRTSAGWDVIEPLEIHEYNGDDLEKMARRRREHEFRAVEKRRQRVSELLQQQASLKTQLMDAKNMLMVDLSTWSFDLHVAELMDRDDPGYVEALEKETRILEKRVEACKSRIMLVTSFDI